MGTIIIRPSNSLNLHSNGYYAQIGGSVNANCLSQDDTYLLQTSKVLDKPKTPKTQDDNIVNMYKISEIFKVSSSTTLDHNYCIPSIFVNVNKTYINNVVAYIADFVAKSIRKSIKCVHCIKLLQSEVSFSAIQTKKCQGRLTKVSPDLIQVCLIVEQCFRTYIFQTENI